MQSQITPYSLAVASSLEVKDSTAVDSIPVKQPTLLDKVKYTAKQYVRINRKENKLYLYDEAELYYQDMELKAGIIVLDYAINEVTAGRIPDSSGVLKQNPYFKQINNEIYPDSLRFNFDTQKALIWNSKSVQNGMNVYAAFTKKENDSVYYIKDAKVTTGGELDNSDYYFRIRKGKMVPQGKIVTGFTNMYIADVPTPLALPFAYFPSSQKQQSGFLFPTIGESNNRGYYLQNGGYYLAMSQFFDLGLTGDYYSNGSYGFRMDSKYRKMYNFNGSLSMRFENLITGERGIQGYAKSTVFNVRWNHSKDPKSSPNSNFSASVNFGTSDYFRESVNQLNSPNFLNNTLSSSVAYSKRIPGTPSVNMSINANMSQNSNTKSINLTLPTFQGSIDRIYPFQPKDRPKKGILQNINFQYSTRAENRIITSEDNLFTGAMFKNARSGIQHSIPMSTNFKILKHFNMAASMSYKEVWQPKTIKYNDYDPTIDGVVKDTLSGFSAYRTYSYGMSMGTTIYGIVNFKEDKKIRSVRHTVRPSLSYSSAPSFDQYYDEYIIDADGNTREYTPFEGGLFGTPSRGISKSMGISISNNFEAKIVDPDSTKTELKKIQLIKNLNFNTSYNFISDEFKWSPVRVSSGIDLFNKKIAINLGATLDMYALNEENKRINEFNIKQGGGLFRVTSANLNTGYNFSNKTFSKDKKKEDEEEEEEEEADPFGYFENTSGGGRDDDLFGDTIGMNNEMNREDEMKENAKYPSYRAEIPWNLRFTYSLTYNNSRNQNDFSNNSLMFSGDVEITPKWKIGGSSGFDFKNHGFTYTQIRLNRDLDSWRLDFSWVPFSNRASWNFFIGIKSGLLSDIKYEKNREPDRRLR
ncbi:MAG: putative LPS assembly protein LptD [Flavobacteriaceae bacterium]|nr:putative LPS assembly protein LptD [Flavobacteriaceae bacterium]